MASDGEDVSTPELDSPAGARHAPARPPVAVPVSLLRAVGSVLGRGAEVERLCGSLVVDASSTRDRLGWSPPLSLDEGL